MNLVRFMDFVFFVFYALREFVDADLVELRQFGQCLFETARDRVGQRVEIGTAGRGYDEVLAQFHQLDGHVERGLWRRRRGRRFPVFFCEKDF